MDALLLSSCLTVVYAVGPNRKRKNWEGILPGVLFALVSWCAASWGLQFYLSRYGSLTHSYGSFAGVIALLLWLYASSIAILLGGEFNAIIAMKLSSSAKRLGLFRYGKYGPAIAPRFNRQGTRLPE